MADSGKLQSAATLCDLPDDELVRYGHELGLDLTPGTPRGELLRRVREREALIPQLDREALLDIVMWMRWPVRKSADKEELVRHIARSTKMDFDDISDRGLHALARLRGVTPGANESKESLVRRIRKAEGLRARLRRKRRSIVGAWMSRVFEAKRTDDGDYHFLPDEESVPIKEQIETTGVVSGIARTIRNVADDYVRQKLDEIERRIDRKLDEIDSRLEEWRDREVANRIRLIRITLITAIIVALISLGYDQLKSSNMETAPTRDGVSSVQED